MFEIPTCPYCGRQLPFCHYGGVGPCSCEGATREREEKYERLMERKAREEAEEHERLHRKAHSCCHEWEGGSLAYTRCRLCGISYGDYHRHK